MSYYIHNLPGRLRLKSPYFKNTATHDRVKKMLVNLHGIATTDFNATTGSLVIFYNPSQIKPADIVHLFQREGYFDPSKALTNDQYIHKASSKIGSIVGKAVFGAVAEKGLEGSALSFLFALI